MTIQEFLDVLGLSIPYRINSSRSGEYSICCPFCKSNYGSDDGEFHCGVNVEKEVFHCFRCSTSGDLLGFASRLTGITRDEAKTKLNGGAVAPPLWIDKALLKEPPPTAASFKYWSEPLTPVQSSRVGGGWFDYIGINDVQSKEAQDYVKSRGHDFTYLMDNYGIRLAARGHGSSPWIVFPDFDPDGNLIYVVYRYAGDPPPEGVPKTLNPSVPRSKVLWGFWRARSYPEVVICEGVFDALRVGMNAVALLSKSVTKDQIILMQKEGVRRVVLFLDADVHQNEVLKNAAALRGAFLVRIAQCPIWRKDPGEMTQEEVAIAVRDAVPYRSGYLHDHISTPLLVWGARRKEENATQTQPG